MGRDRHCGGAALKRGTVKVFIWTLPQVTRDGFVHFEIGEQAAMDPFDEVSFLIALGREASVETR